MAKKLQDQYAAGLIVLGYKEVTSRSSKFRHFTVVASDHYHDNIFLGKAGSVRCNKVGRVSDSFPVSGPFKSRLLTLGA